MHGVEVLGVTKGGHLVDNTAEAIEGLSVWALDLSGKLLVGGLELVDILFGVCNVVVCHKLMCNLKRVVERSGSLGELKTEVLELLLSLFSSVKVFLTLVGQLNKLLPLFVNRLNKTQ